MTTTEEENQYLIWLHDLTTLGYTQEVVFPYHDHGVLEAYYANGNTPAEALTFYMEYKDITPLPDGL